jgi:hypothetical protein
MIVLDESPYVLRARGVPLVFTSPEETLEYARLHSISQWLVFGDPDGWWPLFTRTVLQVCGQRRSGAKSRYVRTGLAEQSRLFSPGNGDRQHGKGVLVRQEHPLRMKKKIALRISRSG